MSRIPLAAVAASAVALLAFTASAEPAPLPAATVGAQALPDLSFAEVPATGELHVSPDGDDAADGSAAAPFRTLARAVAALEPGLAVVAHEGVYEERLALAASGTAAAPLRLVAAPGELPVIRAPSGTGPLLRVTGGYWLVDGLELDGRGAQGNGVAVQGGHHFVLRNANVHAGTGPSGVYLKGSDLAVLDSQIHDFTWGGDRDSHGVVITPDTFRVLVRGNDSWGHDGDSLQCVGPDVEPGTETAADVTVEGNRYHQDRENAVDLKTCERVTLRGNEFFGYRAASTAPQGSALIVHMSARNVLIEQNWIWDNGRALSLGGVRVLDRPVTDVAIRNNVVHSHTTASNGTGDGFRIGTSLRVELSNNTIVGMPNAGIKAGDGSHGPAEDLRIFNNVIVDSGQVLSLATGGVSGLSSDHNLAWNGGAAPRYRVDGADVDLATWRSHTGQDAATVEADPLFVDDPVNAGFYTRPGSPARDAGVATGGPACEGGIDLGAFETCPPATETPTEPTGPAEPTEPTEPTEPEGGGKVTVPGRGLEPAPGPKAPTRPDLGGAGTVEKDPGTVTDEEALGGDVTIGAPREAVAAGCTAAAGAPAPVARPRLPHPGRRRRRGESAGRRFFCPMPMAVPGRASTKRTTRGRLCGASVAATWSDSASAPTAAPGRRTTYAAMRSPRSSSGTPITAASATAGCSRSAPSTSPAPTL